MSSDPSSSRPARRAAILSVSRSPGLPMARPCSPVTPTTRSVLGVSTQGHKGFSGILCSTGVNENKKIELHFFVRSKISCSEMKMVNDEWCKHAVGGVLGFFLQNIAPQNLESFLDPVSVKILVYGKGHLCFGTWCFFLLQFGVCYFTSLFEYKESQTNYECVMCEINIYSR